MRHVAEQRLFEARWLLLLGGLLAGLVAFGIGEAIYEIIPPELVEQDVSGNKVMLSTSATRIAAATKNSALTFGALGACLAGCLGIVGGLARRSMRAVLTGGLLGFVLGIAVGSGVSYALMPTFLWARAYYFEHDILISLLMHTSIWGLLGAAAGLVFAIGSGERRLGQFLTAGFLGAAAGAVAFEAIGAVFFTLADTDEPISQTWPTRLMARLLVTVGMSVAVMLWLSNPPEVGMANQAEVVTPASGT
jgi:hypothetical protein